LLLKLFFVFTELWFHFSMSRKDMLAAVQVGNRHDPWLGRADRKGANRKQETGNRKEAAIVGKLCFCQPVTDKGFANTALHRRPPAPVQIRWQG